MAHHQHLTWANLPSLALDKIFLCSDLNERFECSKVCTHWYTAYLNNTRLSGSLDLSISYSPQLIDLKTLIENYVRAFGMHVRCLKINISSPDLTDLGKYLLNFSLVSLFNGLGAQQQQLVELVLLNLKMTNMPQFISSDIEMLHVIKQYLKSQTSLKRFTMADINIPDEISFFITEIILGNCHGTLEELRLSQLFERQETWVSEKFIKLFENQTNLKRLEIDYHYLSKELVLRLVSSSTSLVSLKLRIHLFSNITDNSSNNTTEIRNALDYYTRNRLSTKTWKHLYANQPKLEVTFVYEDCGIYFLNLFQLTITHKIKLQHLHINWAYIRANHFYKHFNIISAKFSQSLRTFVISLFLRSIFDAQCLFDFIHLSAKQLEIVQFKFDTDDLNIIEYCLQKLKSLLYNYKYSGVDSFFASLCKFHLTLDISSLNDQKIIEFRSMFEKLNFNMHSKFYQKSKFFITIINFSTKTEYSIKTNGERF